MRRHRLGDQEGLGCSDTDHRFEAEVPPANLLVVGGLHQNGSRQAYGRGPVWKDSHHIRAPLDLFVQPLLGSGGMDPGPEFPRKGHIGEDVLFGFHQQLGRLRPARRHTCTCRRCKCGLDHFGQLSPCRKPVRLGKDRPQGGCPIDLSPRGTWANRFLTPALATQVQVSGVTGSAARSTPASNLSQGGLQTFVGVTGDQLDPLQAPPHQSPQEIKPERWLPGRTRPLLALRFPALRWR